MPGRTRAMLATLNPGASCTTPAQNPGGRERDRQTEDARERQTDRQTEGGGYLQVIDKALYRADIGQVWL